VNFILPATKTHAEKTVSCKAAPGQSILDVAHANDVELEGACEGSLACSTCHVIVEDRDVFESGVLGEVTDEENDLLDLAFGLTETSRLGCQIKLTEELDGITVRIPSATRNISIHSTTYLTTQIMTRGRRSASAAPLLIDVDVELNIPPHTHTLASLSSDAPF